MTNEVAVAIIKNKTGKVLIVQRVHPERGNDETRLEWAFPGGRIEEEETPEEAAAREVCDETGYYVNPVKIISQRKHPQFDTNIRYIACDLNTAKMGVAVEVHEIESFKWVEPSELDQYFKTNLDSDVAKYLGL